MTPVVKSQIVGEFKIYRAMVFFSFDGHLNQIDKSGDIKIQSQVNTFSDASKENKMQSPF